MVEPVASGRGSYNRVSWRGYETQRSYAPSVALERSRSCYVAAKVPTKVDVGRSPSGQGSHITGTVVVAADMNGRRHASPGGIVGPATGSYGVDKISLVGAELLPRCGTSNRRAETLVGVHPAFSAHARMGEVIRPDRRGGGFAYLAVWVSNIRAPAHNVLSVRRVSTRYGRGRLFLWLRRWLRRSLSTLLGHGGGALLHRTVNPLSCGRWRWRGVGYGLWCGHVGWLGRLDARQDNRRS